MELVLSDFIGRLTKERKFVTVIKAALRLYGSLKENDLSVLDELFPFVREAILASAPKVAPTPDGGALSQQISAAVQVGVKAAMLELPAGPLVGAPLKSSSAAPPKAELAEAKPLSASEIADNFALQMFQ